MNSSGFVGTTEGAGSGACSDLQADRRGVSKDVRND